MNEKTAYLILQKATGIKEGDAVLVLRKAKTNECGWENNWEYVMDLFIGEVSRVEALSDEGVLLYNEKVDLFYDFPWFVLEKIQNDNAMSAWGDAPDWAQWVATDGDGVMWFHERKPIATFATWLSMRRMMPTGDKGDRDTWRESLRQRPGAEEATQ